MVFFTNDSTEEGEVCSSSLVKEEELCLISTADDNKVKFKLARNIRLAPKQLTRVYLRTPKNMNAAEVILLMKSCQSLCKWIIP